MSIHSASVFEAFGHPERSPNRRFLRTKKRRPRRLSPTQPFHKTLAPFHPRASSPRRVRTTPRLFYFPVNAPPPRALREMRCTHRGYWRLHQHHHQFDHSTTTSLNLERRKHAVPLSTSMRGRSIERYGAPRRANRRCVDATTTWLNRFVSQFDVVCKKKIKSSFTDAGIARRNARRTRRR